MTLSNYERRVLNELEQDLRRPKHPRLAGTRQVLQAYAKGIALAVAGAVLIALAVAFSVRGLIPLAGLLCAVAGFQLCAGRQRLTAYKDGRG